MCTPIFDATSRLLDFGTRSTRNSNLCPLIKQIFTDLAHRIQLPAMRNGRMMPFAFGGAYPAQPLEDNMKHIALALLTGLLLAAPAIAQEKEIDFGQEMELLELEQARAEFEFEQQMRETELAERQQKLDMMRRQGDRMQKHPRKDKAGVACLLLGVVHILMATWVYQDVRRKNNGNGIWIVITLLAGFFGSAVYALVRIGDAKQKQKE